VLWTIAVILIALWVLGLATGTTAGGAIHGLLVLAIAVLLFRIIWACKPKPRTTPASHRGFAYHGILFKPRGSRAHPRPGTGE
jgi:multisubunit Na+/H+ antiporter MnhB subunit